MAEQQGAAKQGHQSDPSISPSTTGQAQPLLSRQEIMDKAQELASLIYNSEEVQHFRRAEQQINGNIRIQKLIGAVKKKQKEVVAFEQTFKNSDMVARIEQEMNTLQEELDGIPIVTDYQESQVEINDLLQMITSAIRDTVAEKISLDIAPEDAPENCD